jgi:hypothetical protein
MSVPLFAYPPQASLQRILPKNKIYEFSKPGKRLRERFVEEVDQIVWKYKLAPETINLPSRSGVPEIQVFGIKQRTEKLSLEVVEAIDRAISFPIVFEFSFKQQLRVMAAYKRPSDSHASKWVVEAYFESAWYAADQARDPLPVALDLGSLYEQLLKRLVDTPIRTNESLRDLVERVKLIRAKELEVQKLESRISKEKQFNRKVEMNSELKKVKLVLESLAGKHEQ